jgi:hypothetical protein
MPSTYSNLKIQLMATGENSTTWGNVTNINLGTALEEAITGSADVAFSSANVTLTLTDTNTSQTARHMRLNLTGTATAGFNLVVPATQKVYLVNNGTDGTITVKNTTGTGIAVPTGKTMWVYNNATNVVDVTTHLTSLTLASALPIASGGTGANTASAARTALGLGTIATQAASSVAITGGSITGITDLTVADGGTGASTASNARTNLGLGTIATQASSAVSITGGTLTGVNLSSSNVTITGGSVTGITDLTVADGGTGSSTASGARTNLSAAASGANTDITSLSPTGGLQVGAPTGGAQGTGTVNATGLFINGVAVGTSSGSVTSVNASGGTTGLTFSGGPITTTGTLTLSGTLALANGGTGATTASAARTALDAQQTLTSGTNIKTLNSTTLLGSGNIVVNSVPSGAILLWSGSVASIPTGWVICDGANSTPDLRNRFLVGAGSTYAVGATGGAADAIVVSHTHTASVTDAGHSHSVPGGTSSGAIQQAQIGVSNTSSPGTTGSATTGISVDISTTGSSATNANLPPYYALCYIMKT